MTFEVYLLYLAALGAFFATPPDVSQFLIMSNSVRHGLARSVWTIVGDLSANTVQMTVAAFGLTAVIAHSAEALTIVKWLGVAYLAWLGVRLILRGFKRRSQAAEADAATDAATDAAPTVADASNAELFRQGFFTSAANPYAVLFFGALFPQFINPDAAIAPQLLILGATYLVVDGVLLVAWGRTARRAAIGLGAAGKAWVRRIPIEWVSGGLMIAAAGLLATKDFAAEPGK